ncbi:MAG: PaaI family thioesterase [Candidatus Dormibacteria bacterium]
MGTEIVSASGQMVILKLRIAPHHLQPHGIVHGGVWAALAETAASIGARLNSSRRVVGMDNHTNFLRAIGEGEVMVIASPIHPGRTTQVWNVVISDQPPDAAATRPVACSTVRLYVLPDGPIG